MERDPGMLTWLGDRCFRYGFLEIRDRFGLPVPGPVAGFGSEAGHGPPAPARRLSAITQRY